MELLCFVSVRHKFHEYISSLSNEYLYYISKLHKAYIFCNIGYKLPVVQCYLRKYPSIT